MAAETAWAIVVAAAALAIAAIVAAAVLGLKYLDARAERDALREHRVELLKLLDDAAAQLDEHRRYERGVVAEARILRWQTRPAQRPFQAVLQLRFDKPPETANSTVYQRIVHDALMAVEEDIMQRQLNSELRMF